jgi:hypothetical protein
MGRLIMDIGSIFLILALLIPVVVFLYRPFMERNKPTASNAEQEYSTLLAKRDQVVATLQELDDDYNLGKIPEEIYPPRRQTLLQNGVEILRQLDAYQMTSSTGSAQDRLEAAIETRRQTTAESQNSIKKNGSAVPPVPDDDLEQKIAARRRLSQSKAGGFCPKCGKPVQEIDRFCPKCGASLI